MGWHIEGCPCCNDEDRIPWWINGSLDDRLWQRAQRNGKASYWAGFPDETSWESIHTDGNFDSSEFEEAWFNEAVHRAAFWGRGLWEDPV